MNDEQIRRARMLRDWYGRLAEKGNGWTIGKTDGVSGPHMQSDLSKYKINPPKPKIKYIDLFPCIESGIDMEFSNVMFDVGQHVDRLVEISQENMNRYACQEDYWEQCRVRQDHWHFWDGGKCPLPEGLEIILKFRSKGRATTISYSGYAWKHIGGSDDVIGFRVLGVAEGRKYPWEKDE